MTKILLGIFPALILASPGLAQEVPAKVQALLSVGEWRVDSVYVDSTGTYERLVSEGDVAERRISPLGELLHLWALASDTVVVLERGVTLMIPAQGVRFYRARYDVLQAVESVSEALPGLREQFNLPERP
jgi:hypothetical protein